MVKIQLFKMAATWLKSKKKIASVLVVILMVPIFSGCGTVSQGYSVSLEVWGTIDESTVYGEAINQYRKLNPYISDIKYRKFSQETYKQELIDALASGQGPDIFLINNSWLPSFENKLEPAPSILVSEYDMQSNFPDVVSTDFVDSGKIYALPLSVDSMQLYYNKDMFNSAAISSPPKTWQDFNNDVQLLTKIDSVGNIVKSGAAMGTSQNVNRFSDVLGLLMIQNSVELPTKKTSTAKLDQGVVGQDGKVFQAGEQALGFYTQFAKVSTLSNISNPLYCWNNRQDNSIDYFAAGKVAMMLNYSWQMKNIKSKNPKLNFGVAPVPQIDPEKPATVANYWGYAVAKNSPGVEGQGLTGKPVVAVPNEIRTHEAWQFLKFLTLRNSGNVTLYNAKTKNSKTFPVSYDPAVEYLKKTQQPAARRDIIESQKGDAFLGVFAAGNLFAKNWYQVDSENIEKIFMDGIDSIGRGDISLHQALVLMTNRINVLMQAKK